MYYSRRAIPDDIVAKAHAISICSHAGLHTDPIVLHRLQCHKNWRTNLAKGHSSQNHPPKAELELIKTGSLPVYAFALSFRNESSYRHFKFPYNGNPPCERLPAWQVTGKFCEGETYGQTDHGTRNSRLAG